MTRRTRLRTVAPALIAMLLAATAITPPARAEVPAVSAEQAKVVEQTLRAWLTGQIGAAVDVSKLPLNVTAEADTYQLAVPFGGAMADGMVQMGTGSITARIKQLDANRWSVEGFRLPSPWTIGVDKKLQDASKGGLSGMTIRIGDQDTRGVIDTSFATTSTLDTKIAGYTVQADSKEGPQITRVDGLTNHLAWQPEGGGLLTVTGRSVADGYKASSMLPDGQKLTIGIGRMTGSLDAKGVATGALEAMIHSFATLAASVQQVAAAGKNGPGDITDADRATARALVKALAGLMGSFKADSSYENVSVDYGGQAGGLRKLALGFDMAAPGGRTELAWRIGLDGLTLPPVVPPVALTYVPRQLTLTPHVGGVSKAALTAVMLQLIDDPDAADDFMGIASGLLEKGPLTAGIRDIAFDIGPAKLTGGGGVKIVSMAEYTGAGEFRMTGLDELIKAANTTPELKEAAPALIFIKGIGKQEGKAVVWKISYEGNRLKVNGTDMTAMMNGK